MFKKRNEIQFYFRKIRFLLLISFSGKNCKMTFFIVHQCIHIFNLQVLLTLFRVCVENHFYCGTCYTCKEGRGDICAKMDQQDIFYFLIGVSGQSLIVVELRILHCKEIFQRSFDSYKTFIWCIVPTRQACSATNWATTRRAGVPCP